MHRFPHMKLKHVTEKIFAGGDLPEGNYSLVKSDQYKIPIYSNGIERNGLYGYTNQAKADAGTVTVSARGTIGFAKITRGTVLSNC